MIHVIAAIRVKEGKISEFLAIFKDNVNNVLQEQGCIEYVPTVDAKTDLPPQETDAAVVTIIEKWSSLDALKHHLAAPHMRTYQQQVKDLVESVSIKVLQAA